ncbi:MAG: hypothetical protein GY930_01850 [bacterium]|nr:hypothetical protein [bacterium]
MSQTSPNDSQTPLTPAQIAEKGWASKMAMWVTAMLVVESITGLWIYLAPFSISAQVQVLVHTVLGLAMTLPYLYYQLRHFLVWYRQKATVMMILGYLLMVAMLVCVVSGFVLTWQGYAGPKITALWDMLHLVSGVAAFVLVILHVVFAYKRRRPFVQKTPTFKRAVGSFTKQGSLVVVGFVILVAAVSFWAPNRKMTHEMPEDYTIPEYLEEYDEYRGSPFAPTNARTENNVFVESELLAGSESCGTSGCHEQILAEWQPSAHRFAAANPPFQAVQKNFAEERDPTQTRYCAGCHDPISLFAGAKDIHNMDLGAPGMQEGDSCVACHSISFVDKRGNADYVLTPPTKYLWEGTDGWKKKVSDFLIRSYPRQHLADYDRNVLRSAEYCGACHKQFIPEALNRFGLSAGQNQYDEWSKSHWHTPEHPETDLSCRDCHMRLVTDSTDPGKGEGGDVRRSTDDGAHRHHGFIATNFLMPAVMKLPHWEEQVKLTEEWIRGETVLPEIAHLWPEGPVAEVSLLAPAEVSAGEAVEVKVRVKNSKVGHNLTTGPLDFTRAWIHLTVKDANGSTIKEWGTINAETRWIEDSPGVPHVAGNSVKDGTMVLEAVPLDAEGKPLVEHDLWRKAGGENQRVIFPKYSDQQSYKFELPADVKGPLTLTAELNFRRYRQEFLDLVVPEMEKNAGFFQPTVTHDSATIHVQVK